MKNNSNLDFMQPSGGNIDHSHHIKLLPLGDGVKPLSTGPILPSGSVWLRGNNGQAERLEYQGRDSSFQARPSEGYGFYVMTIPTDVYPTGTALIMDFDTTVVEDSHFMSMNRDDPSKRLRVHVSGLYRITACMRENVTDGGGDSTTYDITTQNFFQSLVSIGEVTTAIGDGGGQHSAMMTHVYLPPNANISVSATSLNAAGNIIEANLLVEFIRPLDLGNGSNVI